MNGEATRASDAPGRARSDRPADRAVDRATTRADVWVLRLDTLGPDDIARCDHVLSATERDRMRRFHFAPDRDAYRVAHGLARIALSSYEPAVPPHAWEFAETSKGRPEIADEAGLPRLRFNISHARGVVACIVTHECDCGVDVELTRQCENCDFDALSSLTLAPSELAFIEAAPPPDRPRIFCRFWTLKEAFVKALGAGMSVSFDRIAFDLLESSARPLVASDEWHFAQWSPDATHVVATAIHTRGAVHLVRHDRLPVETRFGAIPDRLA